VTTQLWQGPPVRNCMGCGRTLDLSFYRVFVDGHEEILCSPCATLVRADASAIACYAFRFEDKQWVLMKEA